MKTLITGGMVVTPHEVAKADLLLADGRVAAVGRGLSADGARVLDALGRYVLPGGVDAHTHVTLDADATRDADVFYTGSLAAAAGGATAIIDHMAFSPRTLREQTDVYRKLAEGRPVVDYGFHGVVRGTDETALEDLAWLCAQGYSSCKAYMTYDERLDDEALLRLLRRTRELGMVLAVHAEDHGAVTALRAECKALGRLEPLWHPKSRPASCEAEAVARLLRLAARAGDAPVYVVHLSTAAGLDEVRKARAAGQRNIFAETCTQYLILDEQRYADPVEGLRYVMSPPLRPRSDVEALWQGLRNGDIQTVATDHCSFSLADKAKGLGNFMACPGGAPGMEERMAVLFSEGVMRGRISMRTFTDALCANPARIFSLYPRKGALLPGSDADVAIIDPGVEYVLRARDLHGPSDYSLYEGMALRGRVEAVFLRGRLIAKDGVVVGERGRGRFLRRERGMFD